MDKSWLRPAITEEKQPNVLRRGQAYQNHIASTSQVAQVGCRLRADLH
jgi:hypothetical protein